MSLTKQLEGMLAQARRLDDYMASQKPPHSTVDDDVLEELPAELGKVRWELIDALDALKKSVSGPLNNAMEIVFNWTDAVPFRIIYEHRLAYAVPLDGTASYTEIAEQSGLHESWCFRAIRAAIGNGIFDEDKAGRVKHTAISRMLVTNQGFADAVGLQLSELGPASSRIPEVWKRYGANVADPAHSAFSVFNNTDEPFFAVLAKDAERARRFSGALDAMTVGNTWDIGHLHAAIDWDVLDRPGSVIIDLGGGNGRVSSHLARHTRHVHFVVEDQAQVVAAAVPQLNSELTSRIDFVDHDFFTPHPVMATPPAAFLLRWVLHDWSDADCIRILKGLIPALGRGSKILISEYILDDQPTKAASARYGLRADMVMATVSNGRERYLRDIQRLLEKTDSRFVFEDLKRPEGSMMSLVKVRWAAQ